MLGDFSDVIRTIDQMKTDGVISEYAIGGAPSADTFRRRERAARLIDTGAVTRAEIDALIERHRR